MRHLIAFLLALAVCTVPSWAQAQPKKKLDPIEIKRIHVGFRMYKDDDQTAYKAGLWTPIYIEIFGGTDGVAQKPRDRDPPYLEITTNDNDDVGTTIPLGPILVEPLKTRTFLGYVKTGHYSGGASNREIGVVLKVNGRDVKPLPYEPPWNINIDSHLYLTLGSRIEDFHRAMKKLGRDANANVKEPDDLRFNDPNSAYNVVYENDVDRLPERWFGYDGIDLMILSTDRRDFLTELNNHPEQIKAIAQWVRRGGRLVVPISAQTQDAVNAVLTNPLGWQPPIPVVPPKASAHLQLDRLAEVESWGSVQVEPFQRADKKKPRDFVPIPIATLDPGRVTPGDWEVLARSDAQTGAVPLIATVRYGLGQITYLAFSFQDESFFLWKGREKFLQTMTTKLAPKAPANPQDQFNKFGRQDSSDDAASRLLGELDKFGVTVIPFGYVALFIVLYILIVGPLDFFLLKYVFKRLEWTWITFPTVVLAVSVLAYFAAYALKGKDLKINKVDIVDFDLRTSREDPRVYGRSFFTILSPRIQNYTVGLEPNPEFWGAKAEKPKSVDLLSWMGRPSGGFNGMDRGGGGSFFVKPYDYKEDASGLRGVPIPVWTTKAFMASWELPLAKPPFVADLVWHKKDARDVPVSGKLENHLGVDLVDVWLIYDEKFYPLENGLKSIPLGAAPAPLELGKGLRDRWPSENNANDDLAGDSAAGAAQTTLIKQLLFHDFFDSQHVQRNHLLRPLDLGWRIKDDRVFGQNDRRIREAILFARVRPPVGPAETLTTDPKAPLPTKLWLGDLPDEGRSRPALSGQLNQDTYIRVLLPVRPAE